MPELVDVLRGAQALTVPGVLLLLVYLIVTGRLVTRREHEEAIRDRDWWRQIATQALNLGEAAVGRDGGDGS